MKIKSIYISASQNEANSLVVSIGMMQFLKQNFQRVAYFRPIIQNKNDNNINFMLNYFNLKQTIDTTYGFTIEESLLMLSSSKSHQLYETLIEKFQLLQEQYDFVLIEGESKELLSTIIDFDINLNIAKHLNSSFVSVLNGSNKTTELIYEEMIIEEQSIKDKECRHFATFVNNIDKKDIEKYCSLELSDGYLSFFIPYIKDLDKLIMEDVKNSLDCKMIFGTKKNLNQKISDIKIASMGVDNFLKRVKKENLIIVSGDRSDIILGVLSSIGSKNLPHISGIVLTGGIKPKKVIMKLLDGFKDVGVSIVSVKTDTYDTAIDITNIKPILSYKNYTKIAQIQGQFSKYINHNQLKDSLNLIQTDIMTPIMFEFSLFQKARVQRKHIVLNESSDDRILRASEILLHSKVVDITLLGDMVDIKIQAQILGINLDKANIIDPKTSSLLDQFSEEFYQLRKNKGVLKQQAYEIMSSNDIYFATMMVHLGYADGMVSGAMGTTADTVRPALQIIKTKKDIDIVSSIFFMCLDTKVLVYGDCAINPSPNSKELAQIAISSVNTAKQFGIEPKVAMLSYSTGDSGFGEDVTLVANATKEVILNNQSLIIEGPIQFDAAIDKQTALKKSPNGKLKGDATVLIFPDLNTGNNTYKAVQRSSGAVAIGPILQGLNKPVNDLSRGCKIVDIVNTVAITAIQAQGGDL
ncbi:MAG: phosphate acetyltransferase [Campylobacterota bacterium]|nr:phosphate acetyltransferase [Campylobacterota bacterium]